MTDQDLLELAAKAAGLKIDKSEGNGGGAGNTGFDMLGRLVLDWHNNKVWDPLRDDGDALRLANRCGICIEFGYCDDDAPAVWCGPLHERRDWPMTPNFPDPCKATRRAIVEAAALDQLKLERAAGARTKPPKE